MVANDPHNRKQPLILGMIALVSGILLALFVISKVKAASEPQYIFYVNGTLYGTNTQRDIWVYPAGILDNSNVVYSYGPANAVQTIYTKVNDNWQESEAVHLQSTVNFTMVKGTFSYTNYEPEYVDEHFIPLTFDIAYSPKSLVARCTECIASDPFYNVVYFQDHNSFRWYCYAHNGEIRFCNDNIILVQPSGALWYWETEDDLGDRWVLLDTSHVGVQGTDFLVYKAMWFIYARGNNLVAVTDYSSATIPSWPPTHGGGHSFNDGFITPISNFGYDDKCTIDYLQCTFANPVENEPSPTPTGSENLNNSEYDILFYYDPWLTSSSQNGFAGWQNGYYLFSVYGNFVSSVIVNTVDNLAYITANNEGYENPWINNTLIGKKTSANGSLLYLYFGGSIKNVSVRFIGNDPGSASLEVLKSSFEPNVLSFGSGNVNVRTSDYGDISCVYFQGDEIGSNIRSNFLFNSNVNFNDVFSGSVLPFVYDTASKDNILYLAYKEGLTGSGSPSNPEVSPTPTPTATPTPPPYVIIITPDPSPSPTPPFVIPTMPPWNPPGNQIVPLNPDIQDNVFGVFINKIGDNNAFGLIGLLIGLLPTDLMWYLWFLLFILLVVGVAKLIIHFTGG